MKAISTKRFAKFALFGSAGLIALVYAADLAWTASGSSEWKQVVDRDGVQVHSYKAPGSHNTVFRGTVRGKYTQSQVVAALMLENHSLENCKAWIPLCNELKVIEPYSDRAQGDIVLWTLKMPIPLFKNRQYVIKSQTTQDGKTGVVWIDIVAVANKVDLNNCCVRITHIHNRWQISPVRNGEVEIQLTQDFSLGGFFPDLLPNLGAGEETYKLLSSQLPGLINKTMYREARFPYVKEPYAAPVVDVEPEGAEAPPQTAPEVSAQTPSAGRAHNG